MKLAIGDRVETPEGPGTVVGTVEREDRFYKPPRKVVYVLVEPDKGPHVRQWRLAELSSTRAENQAEALAIERHQEQKHQARGAATPDVLTDEGLDRDTSPMEEKHGQP